jgi:heterotetrameric sarcosine oxidase delta subunit
MLRIKCPFCGVRDQTEFRYGGEATRRRPEHPEQASDQEWAEYLFYRENPKGRLLERWVHAYGCRQWFNIVRDTVSHDIIEARPMGAAPAFGSDRE